MNKKILFGVLYGLFGGAFTANLSGTDFMRWSEFDVMGFESQKSYYTGNMKAILVKDGANAEIYKTRVLAEFPDYDATFWSYMEWNEIGKVLKHLGSRPVVLYLPDSVEKIDTFYKGETRSRLQDCLEWIVVSSENNVRKIGSETFKDFTAFKGFLCKKPSCDKKEYVPIPRSSKKRIFL